MRSLRSATKSSPRSPQLEKARAQQRRPNVAKNLKNKYINLLKKKKERKKPTSVSSHQSEKGQSWQRL